MVRLFGVMASSCRSIMLSRHFGVTPLRCFDGMMVRRCGIVISSRYSVMMS
jgi:hypothetical protein